MPPPPKRLLQELSQSRQRGQGKSCSRVHSPPATPAGSSSPLNVKNSRPEPGISCLGFGAFLQAVFDALAKQTAVSLSNISHGSRSPCPVAAPCTGCGTGTTTGLLRKQWCCWACGQCDSPISLLSCAIKRQKGATGMRTLCPSSPPALLPGGVLQHVSNHPG